MIDTEKVTESLVIRIAIVLFNAILHYVLYRATVASIMLLKEYIVRIFQTILKYNLSPLGTSAALPSPLPSTA